MNVDQSSFLSGRTLTHIENVAANLIAKLRAYFDVSQHRGLWTGSALLGVYVGLAVVIFRSLLAMSDSLRSTLLEQGHASVWGWIVPMLFSATGAVLAVERVSRWVPEASGSGIPHLKATLQRLCELHWWRVIPVRIFGSMVASTSGLVLGRVEPTMHIGGAVGDAVARWRRVSAHERLMLIAAGAGAGFAATFNAPLAGLVFVYEGLQHDLRRDLLGAAFIAAAIATVIARFAGVSLSGFQVPHYAPVPITLLPFMALLGVIIGVAGVAFNRSLIGVLRLLEPLQKRSPLGVAAVLGALIGIAGWFSPLAVGSGHQLVENVLNGQVVLLLIPLWFFVRAGLTILSYGTDAPGGVFVPVLGLGALVGLGFGQLGHWLAPELIAQPSIFAIIGMAAYFTVVAQAPLTGIVLMVEMTGDFALALPLIISCLCAYAVAHWLHDVPVYEALLKRDLWRGIFLTTPQRRSSRTKPTVS